MGYQRAHGEVVAERLVVWFLFGRKFHMEISQLAELYKAMLKPVRLGRDWGIIDGKYGIIPNPKKEQVKALLQQLNIMIQSK